MEHFQLEWLLMEELLQRSLEVPLLPTIPSDQGDFIMGNFNTQPSFVENPEINPSNNLNFYPQIPDNQMLEGDCEWWSSICTELEDEWKQMHSQVNPNPNPNPNPNIPFLVDDHVISTNPKNNNYNDDVMFFNMDETLNAVVEEGLRKSLKEEESVISENELDDLIMSNCDDMNYNKQIKSTSKMNMLNYEEIRKYFDLPISMAAKELKVGLTVLKKRCRELNIKRWPHRKIKSLNSLISNVKEMGLAGVAEALEEHIKKLEVVPGMELTVETKRLRQACFKANYKKRRALALLASNY